MLGIDRTVLLDWIGFQGLIDYRTFKTPRDLFMRFHDVGVTHVVFLPSLQRPPASKQEHILFDTFAAFYGVGTRDVGELRVFEMPPQAPPDRPPFRVAVRGMNGYSDGIYSIEALSVCEEMPPQMQVFPGPEMPIVDDAAFANLIAGVDAALIGTDARGNSPLPPDQFLRVGGRSNFDIYARRVTAN